MDEVVVYDDSLAATTFQPGQPLSAASVTPGTALLARILQYLDTPPHLRPNMYPEEVLQQARVADWDERGSGRGAGIAGIWDA